MPTIFPIIINKAQLDSHAFAIEFDSKRYAGNEALQYVEVLLAKKAINIAGVNILIVKPETRSFAEEIKDMLSEYEIEYTEDFNN